jgi:hypothetical protein
MILSYGFSIIGPTHVELQIVCQDSNYIKVENNLAIAAVADGLGSCQYSDVASKIAAQTSVNYCANCYPALHSDDEVFQTIKESFQKAFNEIELVAKQNSHDLDQYDTTLTLAILDNGVLYYGHSGDGGIITLSDDGLFEKITTEQNDLYGYVFPLIFGPTKWEIAKWTKKVASVMLLTDGMLKPFFPVYIKDQDPPIYVALAKYFMDSESLQIASEGEENTSKRIREFVAGISKEQVDDDKTVVVLVNPDIQTRSQPPEYYEEPDWDTLIKKYREEWNKKAYPSLYQDKTAEDFDLSTKSNHQKV